MRTKGGATGRCKATTGKSGINPKPTTEASYLTFKSTLKCIQDTVRSEKERETAGATISGIRARVLLN